ncbi:MAG: ABC transporter permease subunit, partial [Pseudonocardiaceae bacterium]
MISFVVWAPVARELRAQVLSLRERDHIQALRAMGAGAGYVLPRHVVPAVAPLVVPQFVLATKTAILLESSLAFLGLGDVTAKSWGTLADLLDELRSVRGVAVLHITHDLALAQRSCDRLVVL